MLRTLTRALARVGIEVHVATTDDNDHQRSPRDRREPIQEDGVTYWYFKRRFRFYSVCPPLGRWLGAHVQDYHLIHIHALFNYPAVAASAWAWRRRIPYIVRPLGTLNRWGMQHRRPWVKKVSFPLIERRILAHAALVHYTSEQERLEATELGVRAPSAVIPNALDGVNLPAADPAAFRARYPQLRDRSVVLFLSRLDQKKGLDLLLPAFRKVREARPAAALVIVGTGEADFAARLHEQARGLGLEDHIVWTGFLDGARKSEALSAADIFVLPSYSENFGIAVLEGAAAGLPLVVSDQVAIHREITAANAGIVVACEPSQLSDAILRLLDDEPLRKQMGANGQALSKTFSLDLVTSQLVAAYERVAISGLALRHDGRSRECHHPGDLSL